MLGTAQKVLIEGRSIKNDSEFTGRADNNKVINFPANKNLIGTFANILVTEVKGNTLYGEVLEDQVLEKTDYKRAQVVS